MTRPPIVNLFQYRHDHLEFSSLTAEYISFEWGAGKLTKEEVNRTLKRAIDCSFAINMHSRIAHATAASEVLADVVASNAHCSFYAIDLVCRDFNFDLPNGRVFDVRLLKKWVKARLRGVNYVGGIDLAYYYAGDLVPGQKPPYLSWHAHVIAWDVPEKRLRELKRLAEMQFSAGWTGAQVFYYRKLANDKVVGRAMYALKSAMSEYSVKKTTEAVDTETGEVKGGKAVQKKRALRPASRLEIIKAIGSRSISELMIAGGRGKKARTSILIRAFFQQMLEASAHQDKRIAALGLPPDMLKKLL